MQDMVTQSAVMASRCTEQLMVVLPSLLLQQMATTCDGLAASDCCLSSTTVPLSILTRYAAVMLHSTTGTCAGSDVANYRLTHCFATGT